MMPSKPRLNVLFILKVSSRVTQHQGPKESFTRNLRCVRLYALRVNSLLFVFPRLSQSIPLFGPVALIRPLACFLTAVGPILVAVLATPCRLLPR